MKNKIIIILVGILLFIALVCLMFWGHKKFMNSIYRPGPDIISRQKNAIVYHPYNEGIIQIANIIGSNVKADVYRLESANPYPASADLAKEKMKQENYEAWVEVYEQFYNKKLVYSEAEAAQ